MSLDLAIDVPLEDDEHDSGDFPPGTVLVGRYRVQQVLGRGGMGSVYLAEHIEVGRKVAIKVLLARWSETESIVRRFRAEARTASGIGHPNIVQVFDAGVLPDGRLFLVMEHLAGRDLEEEMLALGTFDVRRACVIMRQIALALGAGHRAGVVHRDLKPSNIMLVPQAGGEAVKVLDFGIAANAGLLVGGAQRLTDPGSLMGTPEYMAPEQATNAEPLPTFDVYAMGVMLFEMVSGDIPFTALHAFELLTFKLNRPAPSLDTRQPGLPPELVELVADCLEIDPEARPRDGDAVAARLEALLEETGAETLVANQPLVSTTMPMRTIAPPRPAPRWWQVHAWSALLVALTMLCAGSVAWLVWPDPPEPPELAAVVPAPEPAPRIAPPPLPVPKDSLPPAPFAEVVPEAVPPPELEIARPTAKPSARPGGYSTPRCQRVRASAETARRSQRWATLRDNSRERECWASAAEARKLETKALMELGDFKGCMSVGKGLKDQEAQGWIKLCQKRVGG